MIGTIAMLVAALAVAVQLIHHDGRVVPGLNGIQESQRQTEQVGEAVATHQFTFALEGDYDDVATLSPVPAAFISAQSGGSASGSVSSVVIDSVTAAQVQVTVTLDAAPGAGETTDIACSLLIAGPGAR